jgi:putative transposase
MMDTIRQATGHPFRVICAVLEVPRSSYFHATKRTATQRSDDELEAAVEPILREHRRRYGYRRIYAELTTMGLTCAPERVRPIMQERGHKAIQPSRLVPKTSDGRADRPSLNLLLDQPLPQAPNAVRAGHITYIPTGKGWLYLHV